jgi:hypothetical protein
MATSNMRVSRGMQMAIIISAILLGVAAMIAMAAIRTR